MKNRTAFDITMESLMTPEVVTVQLGDEAEYAALQMSSHGVSCVLVCQGRVPIGLITEKIITATAARRDFSDELLVDDVMLSPVLVVNRQEILANLFPTLRTSTLRYMPVVNEDRELEGLVSQTDILQACIMLLEQDMDLDSDR